ncbi:hypothetical protein PMKS-001406 [Pichia membranifaciens]|uniref:Uncharacterized protein n=1 Tax=Pichia membranifaciens TaxID=4926 RepID=A0A1Q2YEK1_9ASCO|nr:hypothetical protein PMKS-001406 [Pichia membranifaciens]
MSPKVKAKRLKVILLQLIQTLPDGEFPNKQLPFINAVINFIDQTPSPLDSFKADEMITLLRSVLGGMSLQDVRYIDFFPRFYNSLRECKEYADDSVVRLQLFEIFVNYVLLSTKRHSVSKVIQAFITEEQDVHKNNVNEQVVDILLEAFQSIKPDTETVLLLAKICPDLSAKNKEVSDLPFLDRLLATFFKAADEEISESFEDNFVSERLVTLLDILEPKVSEPLETYVEILYFSVKNNFDEVSKNILVKLEKLTSFFTSEKYESMLEPDVIFALVTAALKFNKANDATNLIKVLKKKKESDYIEDEWMTLLQYESFELTEGQPAIQLVKKLNQKLDDLDKDYAFGDIDSLNLVLESLCWSNKSFEYIEQFRKDFDDEFGVPMDSKSVATIMDYLCQDKNNNKNVKRASQYFLQYKDQVDWENDYEGFYMLSLFQLTANVWQNPEISWAEKLDVYQNVQRYEYLFNKECVYEMMKAAIKYDAGTFAVKILLDQTPELKKDDPRLEVSKYQKIFDCTYDYLIKSTDGELNKRVYKYLADYFAIPYEYYPGFVKIFIDCSDPEMALKVFADMKRQSKESQLPPPGEEFYIYLLKSFAKFQDEEGIFKLHLAIKMDLSINLDIKLLNSLMESYAALEDPFKTRDVFNLAFSLPKEYGTNNESAYWMLKSLKYATLGHAKDFYNGLSEYDILPDPNLFAELLIANCYFEQYRTAFETLESAEKNGDYHLINGYVLKTLHNNCLHDGVRNELKQYCQKTFPTEWEELVKTGQLEDNTKDYPDLLASPYSKASIEVKQISDS